MITPCPVDVRNPVLTMGVFDGVHLGHCKLLDACVEAAREISGESVVITYRDHPLETLHKIVHPYLLTERARKDALLREAGVAHVLYLRFDAEMAALEPGDFLRDVLLKCLRPRVFIVGCDTRFGRGRTGDYEYLKAHESEFGFVTRMIEPLAIDGEKVSSSRIRDLVRTGAVDQANNLLGRPYSVVGTVVSGDRIGRALGFPTINLKPLDEHKLLPQPGVYLCRAMIGEDTWTAVANVGFSPSIKVDQALTVEAHLLDFSGDLYGQDAELFFVRRLRNEIRFETRRELVDAIAGDVAEARRDSHA
jgi:riboflavin kinase / FMN adenylyltransferase